MTRMKFVSLATALSLTVLSGAAFAQTPPPGQTTPPKPQTAPPPAQTPPASAQTPPKLPAAATAAPVIPFPADGKIAYFDLQRVASESIAGKAASAQRDALVSKKTAELQSLQTQITALQQKKQTSGSLLSSQAVSQMDKDIERLSLDLQYKQQGGQKEIEDLTNDLMEDFYKKVLPVVEAIGKEKNLWAIYNIADSGAIYIQPGLDLSAEVVKRFDAVTKK
jgi:Skp family chaperone for outer membrane proteins